MSVRWVTDDGRPVSPDFEDQPSAEEWMGREWERLLGEGTEVAILMDDDKRLYRMKLTPAT